MNERPILFSAPMVRALLDGTKTQTRRVVKPQPGDDIAGPLHCEHFQPSVVDRHGNDQPGKEIFGAYDESGEWGARCPYGAPGDRLWVRETWAHSSFTGNCGQIAAVEERLRHPHFCHYSAEWSHSQIKWTPGIHMPRWASRITLEVTEVRVERLLDISEADAVAEGILELLNAGIDHDGTPIDTYRVLWKTINGVGSWAANPWVWVVGFKVLG
ncbi:MAG: hypothetical protein JWQ72_3649 [Polaromonas sp.]|nr:hypothetical protein [Polaromonas sp.]